MTRRSSRRKTYTVCLAFSVLGGCAAWNSSTEDVSRLPAPKMSTDSVVLDIYFIRAPAEDGKLNEQLWAEVDEQILPVEMREQLLNNGFRCGLVGSVLPKALDHLMNYEGDAPPAGDMKQVIGPADSQSSSVRRRRQSRTGRRFEILASKPQEKISGLISKNGVVSGEDFYQAQCLFSAKTFPLDDGRVRFELRPEIRHGQLRNIITSELNGGSFVIKTGQDRKAFDHLNLEITLSTGQSLLITCSTDFKGLGKEFFIEQSDGLMVQKLILVRLSQTQSSELIPSE